MKSTSAVVVMVVALSTSSWAQTQADAPAPMVNGSSSTSSRGRGWLTGLGVALIGGGIAALAIGAASSASAAQSDALLKVYDPPTQAEAASAKALIDRRDAAAGLALPMFIVGGAFIAGGLISVIVDTVFASAPRVGFISLPSGGGMLTFGGSF